MFYELYFSELRLRHIIINTPAVLSLETVGKHKLIAYLNNVLHICILLSWEKVVPLILYNYLNTKLQTSNTWSNAGSNAFDACDKDVVATVFSRVVCAAVTIDTPVARKWRWHAGSTVFKYLTLLLQSFSLNWTSLTWLNLPMVVKFYAIGYFNYCPSCLTQRLPRKCCNQIFNKITIERLFK